MRAMLLFTALAVGCGGASEPTEPGRSAPTDPTSLHERRDIDVEAFAAKHGEGVTVIDVRTPGEYASGHVPGAVNLPISDFDPTNEEIRDLPKDEPVYLICATGGRSARAADTMAAAGFDAVNVEGGTKGWIAAGHPVEK